MLIDTVTDASAVQEQVVVTEAQQVWLRQHEAVLAQTSLTHVEQLAVAFFVTTLRQRFPNLVDSIILYGSAARGDMRWQSDVDLLVLTTEEVDVATKEAMQAISHDSQWRHHCVMNALIFPPSKQQRHQRGSSLWLNIQTDGVVLCNGSDATIINRNAWPDRFTPERGYQMTEAQNDEIRIHMERAVEELDAAELMLNSFLERPAISHSYYAIFHAASALLLTKGVVQARHSGVRSQLGHHFFRPAILPPEWSKLYHTLQEERESATYEMEYEPGETVAEQRLLWAKEFVETARRYLIEHNFLSK